MNFKEASKTSWVAAERPTVENINAGSLQRIADACEAMVRVCQLLARDAKRRDKKAAGVKKTKPGEADV